LASRVLSLISHTASKARSPTSCMPCPVLVCVPHGPDHCHSLHMPSSGCPPPRTRPRGPPQPRRQLPACHGLRVTSPPPHHTAGQALHHALQYSHTSASAAPSFRSSVFAAAGVVLAMARPRTPAVPVRTPGFLSFRPSHKPSSASPSPICRSVVLTAVR
jgi:hypothetical protein